MPDPGEQPCTAHGPSPAARPPLAHRSASAVVPGLGTAPCGASGELSYHLCLTQRQQLRGATAPPLEVLSLAAPSPGVCSERPPWAPAREKCPSPAPSSAQNCASRCSAPLKPGPK